MSRFLKAHLLLLFVAFSYSLNYFIAKQIFEEVHPFVVIGLRAIFGAVFFGAIYFIFIREKVDFKQDWLKIVASAFFGVSFNQLFFIWGLSYTSEINASVLMITAPIFVLILGYFINKTPITSLKVVGLVICVVGAFFLIGGKKMNFSGKSVIGDVMIIVNAASYGIYLVLVKPLLKKYNPFTIVAYLFFFGAILNFSLGLPHIVEVGKVGISAETSWRIAYVLVFVTAGAYLLNMLAMKSVGSLVVGVYVYLQPVLTNTFSLIIHKDLNLEKIAFSLLVILGVFLTSYADRISWRFKKST